MIVIHQDKYCHNATSTLPVGLRHKYAFSAENKDYLTDAYTYDYMFLRNNIVKKIRFIYKRKHLENNWDLWGMSINNLKINALLASDDYYRSQPIYRFFYAVARKARII